MLFICSGTSLSARLQHCRKSSTTGDKVVPLTNANAEVPIAPPTMIIAVVLVNPGRPLVNAGRQMKSSIWRESMRLLSLLRLRPGWHMPCNDGVHSRSTLHREQVDRRHTESHEGINHKRVCIARRDRDHRTYARAGRCPGKRHGRVWPRTTVIGTNSMWRCCERDQWLWTPHDPEPNLNRAEAAEGHNQPWPSDHESHWGTLLSSLNLRESKRDFK
jgi:hypothetical protein